MVSGIATAFDISALGAANGVLVPAAAGCTVRGFSLGSFGGTARIRLREGTVTGKILVTLEILDGQTPWDGQLNLACSGPVFVQFVAGGANLEGSIWIA